MDKVRFSLGTHVFQGFHDGDFGMAGALVWVTANTLREVADVMYAAMTTDFDREHNAPTEDWDTLAFGDAGTIMSPVDGVTPLYRLTSAEPTIVQRFDPSKGRFGQWVNVDTLDGYFGRQDDWVPVTHGFVISASDWAAGRGDAPPIAMEKDKAEAEPSFAQVVSDTYNANLTVGLPEAEPEIPEWETDPERLERKRIAHQLVMAWWEVEHVLDTDLSGSERRGMHDALDAIIADYVPGYNAESLPEPGMGEDYGPNRELVAKPKPVTVARVAIEYSNGSKATMDFETPESNGSGTTYEGEVPAGNEWLETNLSNAVTEAGLWPKR